MRHRLLPALALLLVPLVDARAVDLGARPVTVLTIARDGAWGVATAGAHGPAIGTAIRECRQMARSSSSDCGAHFVAVHGRWVVGNLCGDRVILGLGVTEADAEDAALRRESELRRHYAPGMPACARVVAVDPDGLPQPGVTALRGTGASRAER